MEDLSLSVLTNSIIDSTAALLPKKQRQEKERQAYKREAEERERERREIAVDTLRWLQEFKAPVPVEGAPPFRRLTIISFSLKERQSACVAAPL